MPLKLSKADALLSARALHAQAAMRRKTAEECGAGQTRDLLLAEAANFERVAKLHEDHAASAPKKPTR